MIVWFCTNVFLSLFALAFERLNETAPHRLRFLVCFFALFAWLIPWGSIGWLLPSGSDLGAFSPWSSPVDVGAMWTPTGATIGNMLNSVVDSLPVVLIVLTIFGVVLFSLSAFGYIRFVSYLAIDSRAADHLWDQVRLPARLFVTPEQRPRLRIQRCVPGALTTGLLAPTIWLHEDLTDNPGLPAALLHEHRHIAHGDNAYLWVITLIERLFWWNPLVRYLGSRVRSLQELACDEACAKELPEYRVMLNRLILSLSITGGVRRSHPQVPAIHSGRTFNLRRARALERRYTMRTRHYIGICGLVISSAFAINWAIAQSPDEERDPRTVDEVLEASPDLSPIAGFEPGTTMEEANEIYRSLKLYAMLVERQYDVQAAEIERLRERLGEEDANQSREEGVPRQRSSDR